jgi:hypothetical protein
MAAKGLRLATPNRFRSLCFFCGFDFSKPPGEIEPDQEKGNGPENTRDRLDSLAV